MPFLYKEKGVGKKGRFLRLFWPASSGVTLLCQLFTIYLLFIDGHYGESFLVLFCCVVFWLKLAPE